MASEEFPRDFHLARKRGLAILVTCDYEGTQKMMPLSPTSNDAAEMKMTFEQFDYDIHQLKNGAATEYEITALLKQASDYLSQYDGPKRNSDGEKKVIIFAFSGHGTSHGTREDRIITNDGRWFSLREQVMLPLLRHPNVCDIPKLFFIDAARGSNLLLKMAEVEMNFRIDYSTIPDYVAYGGSSSFWMPVLARKLRERDDTFSNVMDQVNEEIYTQNEVLQQPEAVSRLNGRLKLYYNQHEPAPETATLTGSSPHGTVAADAPEFPRVFRLAQKRGLAILVTCDYEGTRNPPLPSANRDAVEMKMTFEQFDYDIHQLKNGAATEYEITALLKQAADYLSQYDGPKRNSDGEKKVIIFAFSGYGREDRIITNDGRWFSLREQVMYPLLRHPNVRDIPKLFFIDADRGSDLLRKMAEVEMNFRIDYSTIPDYVAYGGSSSFWMPVLARKLRERDDTFSNVMDQVNEEIFTQNEVLQQPEAVSRLNGRLKLYYNQHEPTPETATLTVSAEEAEEIVKKARESGSLKQRITVAVVTGIMGAGKTCFLKRVFGLDIPDKYTSSSVASNPQRGVMRHIAKKCSLKLLSRDEILKLLAPLLRKGVQQKDVETLANDILKAASSSFLSPTKPSPALNVSQPEKTSAERTLESEVQEAEVPAVVPAVVSAVVPAADESAEQSAEGVDLELIHISDTGGQPEFMETMPSLVHNSDLMILVLDLTKKLDECPTLSYHEGGTRYKKDDSLRTNRQIIRQLIRTMQAKRARSKGRGKKRNSKFLVIGTHKDCIEELLKEEKKKLLGEKKEKLLEEEKEMLLQEVLKTLEGELKDIFGNVIEHELILYKGGLIFPLNLEKPDSTDEEVLGHIRKSIAIPNIEGIDTPLSFFMFEQNAHKYVTEELCRDVAVLSLEECLRVGARLGMTPTVVQAALLYFHKYNVFLYFQDIPNLVFLDPQVPLAFVNAIVRFSYKAKENKVPLLTKKQRDCLEEGTITEDLLECEELSASFVDKIYQPQDAIDLFQKIYTIAPLSAESVHGTEKEYLMMCLLPYKTDHQISCILPSSSCALPLLVRFNSDCTPNGCFGNTVSCLISRFKWKISSIDGKPQCLAHNIVTLSRGPMKVTLVDSEQYFEIHVNTDNFPDIKLQENCSQTRSNILDSVKEVLKTMHYDELEVEPAFLCSCKYKKSPHAAMISDSSLTCTKTDEYIGELEWGQGIWFQDWKGQREISKPNFDEMQRLNIIERSASKCDDIGAILLNDGDGTLVGNIRIVARDDQQKIVRAIYGKWIGEDEDCSWAKLAWCLRRVHLNPLATEIEQCFRLPQRQHPMPYQQQQQQQQHPMPYQQQDAASNVNVTVSTNQKQQQHPRHKKCLLA